MIQSNYSCSNHRALYNLQMKFYQYYIINSYYINYACVKKLNACNKNEWSI